MTAKDQLKVINAGFRIIRRDYVKLIIKYKSMGSPEWSNYMTGFKSKAALDRTAVKLLEMPFNVED